MSAEEVKTQSIWVVPNVELMTEDFMELSEEERIAWEQLQTNMQQWFLQGDEAETEPQKLWREYVMNCRILWLSYLDRSLYPLVSNIRKGNWEDVHETVFICQKNAVCIPTLRQVSIPQDVPSLEEVDMEKGE